MYIHCRIRVTRKIYQKMEYTTNEILCVCIFDNPQEFRTFFNDPNNIIRTVTQIGEDGIYRVIVKYQVKSRVDLQPISEETAILDN